MTPIKLLDLFAGAGGLSLGFESARDANGNPVFELHRAVEIDGYACDTLRSRYGSEKVIEGDITKLDIATKIIRECKGEVSVVVGGIPCQSFSLLGPRSGYGKKLEKWEMDKRDNLYEHFRDIVAEVQPNIFVIENVKGILSKKNGNGEFIIDKLISDFESLGYNFENEKTPGKYMILNAADYGVPQRRERVIIVGIRKGWRTAKVPYVEPTHSNSPEKIRNNKLLPYLTLAETIGDLPPVSPMVTSTGLTKQMNGRVKKKNGKTYSGIDRVQINKTRFSKHLQKLSDSGVQYFGFVRPNGYEYIDHHTARSHQLSDIKLFELMKEGQTSKDIVKKYPITSKKLIKYTMSSFMDKYRKQVWNEPSTTIFAHLAKDGNRFIHPKQARTFTPREVARIQSFPDDFVFSGPISKKYIQIGNAVPPILSKALAESLLKILI